MASITRQLIATTFFLADGITANWNFSFAGGYLDKSHIKAYKISPDGLRTDITVVDAMVIGTFQLAITPMVEDGYTLCIYRDTPKDLPIVNFEDESGLSEIALDVNAKQAIFVAAESSDVLGRSISLVADILEFPIIAEQSANSAIASAAAALVAKNSAEADAAAAELALSGMTMTYAPERQLTSVGQTVFTLINPYSVGKPNSMVIYADGFRLPRLVDYVETSSNVVTFNTPWSTAGVELEFVSGTEIGVAVVGPQGPTGPQGEVGPQGPTGPQGPMGATNTAPDTHAATSKITPVDADELPLVDSASSFSLKKLTWANLKATLAAWISGGTLAGSFTTLTTLGNLVLRGPQAGTATAVVGFFKGSDDVVAGYWGFGGTGTPFEFSNFRGSGFSFNDSGSRRLSIDTAGNVLVTAPALIGYGIGAGGTVTQATSKSTAVTLNKPCGVITTNNAALAPGVEVIFSVNNSLVGTNDVVIVNQRDYIVNTSLYSFRVLAVTTGGFLIGLKNISGASQSDAVPINFVVIKGATS